ncbi:unnamed protein product [Amoebophrya sp. A25]|nr:unnamed protein product [Amoebophrya sp. A25]|eukprot:GSA25T00011317001.1
MRMKEHLRSMLEVTRGGWPYPRFGNDVEEMILAFTFDKAVSFPSSLPSCASASTTCETRVPLQTSHEKGPGVSVSISRSSHSEEEEEEGKAHDRVPESASILPRKDLLLASLVVLAQNGGGLSSLLGAQADSEVVDPALLALCRRLRNAVHADARLAEQRYDDEVNRDMEPSYTVISQPKWCDDHLFLDGLRHSKEEIERIEELQAEFVRKFVARKKREAYATSKQRQLKAIRESLLTSLDRIQAESLELQRASDLSRRARLVGGYQS